MSNLLDVFENDVEAASKFVGKMGAGWFVKDRDALLGAAKNASSADVAALNTAGKAALFTAGSAAATAGENAIKSGQSVEEAGAAALSAAQGTLASSGQNIEDVLVKTTVGSVMADLTTAPAPAAQ